MQTHPVLKDDLSKCCSIPLGERSCRVGKTNSRKVLGVALWIGSVALALGVGTVVGQSMPPKGNTGVKIGDAVVLDLAPWAEDMKGRQLRIRRFDIAPGGVIGIHSHDDRPDVSYLVQGNLIEHLA